MNHIISISETHSEEALKIKAKERLTKLISESQLKLRGKFSHQGITIDIVSMENTIDSQDEYIMTCTVLLSGTGFSLGPTKNCTSMKIYNTEYFTVIVTQNGQARENITHKIKNEIIEKASESVENFFITNNNAANIGKLNIIFGDFKNYSKKRSIKQVKHINE